MTNKKAVEIDEKNIIEEEQPKIINPSTDKDNYLIQVISDGRVMKEVIALNSTVNVIHIGEQAVAADIK